MKGKFIKVLALLAAFTGAFALSSCAKKEEEPETSVSGEQTDIGDETGDGTGETPNPSEGDNGDPEPSGGDSSDDSSDKNPEGKPEETPNETPGSSGGDGSDDEPGQSDDKHDEPSAPETPGGEQKPEPEPETVSVTGIEIQKASIAIQVGQSAELESTIFPLIATNKNVVWAADSSIVSVSGDCEGATVVANAQGTAMITVTTEDGNFSATCKVIVTAAEEEKEPEPEITQPVEGGVKITATKGDLEAAYVEWEPVANAVSYNVYVKKDGGQESKLDAQLIRKYKTYVRADAVGLSAGNYTMRVVPVDFNNAEVTASQGQASGISVKSHERAGFAFVNGSVPGAYKADGTLKDGAKIIYITQNSKNTVRTNVKVNAKGGTSEGVGLQGILDLYKKGYENTPLAVRLIGDITDLDYMDKGDIVVDTKNNTSCYITIEGIGNDATVNGWGIRLKNAENIEVRNLGFMNCDSGEGDCLGLQQNINYIWTHNNDYFYGNAGSDKDQAKGDGSLDTKGGNYVTHSYNHFWDSGKCNLQGLKAGEETGKFVTYHHNWYDHSDSRHPRIRVASVHVYNNYYDGNAKYGIGATMGACVFSEANYFRSTAKMKPMLSSMQGTDALGQGTFSGEDGGMIKSFGNVYVGERSLITYQQNNTSFDVYEASARNEQIPSSVKTLKGGTSYNNFDTDSSIMYSYTPDTAQEAMNKVKLYAGRIDGGDFKYEFDNATEDGNYSVIQALKDRLTLYKGSVEKIYGDAPASGGTTNPDPGTQDPDPQNPDPQDPGTEEPEAPITQGVTVIFAQDDSSIAANGITVTNGEFGATQYVLNGTTYTTSLKLGTTTNVSFSLEGTYKVTLYVTADGKTANDISDDKKVIVNGETKKTKGSKIVLENISGTVTITKGDSARLRYMIIEKL